MYIVQCTYTYIKEDQYLGNKNSKIYPNAEGMS